MSRQPPLQLDPILHQPVRTRLAAYLASRGDSTFTELKQALDITDGNLEAHLKKLTGSRYVQADRQTHGGRPQTTYRLTAAGQEAFSRYVHALSILLPFEGQ